MTFDPFAEAESHTDAMDEVPATDPPERDIDLSQTNSEPLVSVTLKGGSGYDAPWTVLKFSDIRSADHELENNKEYVKRILDNSAQMGGYYSRICGKGQSSSSAGNAPVSGAQEAPNGEERYCAHGKMIFRSGVSQKTGRPYQLFACPVQDRNQQCKAQFLS